MYGLRSRHGLFLEPVTPHSHRAKGFPMVDCHGPLGPGLRSSGNFSITSNVAIWLSVGATLFSVRSRFRRIDDGIHYASLLNTAA
jgi:hypothetical protein